MSTSSEPDLVKVKVYFWKLYKQWIRNSNGIMNRVVALIAVLCQGAFSDPLLGFVRGTTTTTIELFEKMQLNMHRKWIKWNEWKLYDEYWWKWCIFVKRISLGQIYGYIVFYYLIYGLLLIWFEWDWQITIQNCR